MKEKAQVVIIGSGPAGLTAAIYAARASLDTVVFEGMQPGGQLMITNEVENYPGFPEGIMGPDLMDNFRKQAEKFGTEFIQDEVTSVDLGERPFRVSWAGDKKIYADTLIIATGATARWMNIESEAKLKGHGVSACATCDGFFFTGKKVGVVGGGDTAMEDANHLTHFASEVFVIHRRDKLRASKFMGERAMKNPKIKFIWDSVVEECLGEPSTGLKGVTLRNRKTDETSRLDIDGLFIAIGHTPNNKFLDGQLPLDENGFLQCEKGTATSSIPGVFIAGDVRDSQYQQAVTAAGMGCMAALEAQEFIEAIKWV